MHKKLFEKIKFLYLNQKTFKLFTNVISTIYQWVRPEPVGQHHPLSVGLELVVILVGLTGVGGPKAGASHRGSGPKLSNCQYCAAVVIKTHFRES